MMDGVEDTRAQPAKSYRPCRFSSAKEGSGRTASALAAADTGRADGFRNSHTQARSNEARICACSRGAGTVITDGTRTALGRSTIYPPACEVIPRLSTFLLGPWLICSFRQSFLSVHKVKGPVRYPGVSDANKANWRVQHAAGEADAAARCRSEKTGLTPLDQQKEILLLQARGCWRDHDLSTQPPI